MRWLFIAAMLAITPAVSAVTSATSVCAPLANPFFSAAMASGFGVVTPKGRCYPFWLVRVHVYFHVVAICLVFA